MTASLYTGDALEVMRGLPPASVDAVIMDPPYCSGGFSEADRRGAKSQGVDEEVLDRLGWFVNDNMGTAGLVWLLRSVGVEASRLVRPGGWLLCFCDWRQLTNLAPPLESAGFRFRNVVVWDKGTPAQGLGFRAQHEMVLAFSIGTPVQHDPKASNVIRVGRQRDRVHPTQKPVDVMAQLVRATTPAAGVVLDPFMGSGSTGVAACALGRSFIGIERDPAHVANALARIESEAGVVAEYSGVVTRKPSQPSLLWAPTPEST